MITEYDSRLARNIATGTSALVNIFKTHAGSLVHAMVRARRLLPAGFDQRLFHAPRNTVPTLASVPNHLDWLIRDNECLSPTECGPAIDLQGRRWKDLERQYTDRTAASLFIGAVRHGRILGRQLSVLTPGGDVILDCSPTLRAASKPEFGNPDDPERHRALRRYLWLPPPRRIHGSVAVAGCAGAGNYYHWLIDALPRLLAILDAGKSGEIDYVAVPRSALPAIRDSLALIGINKDRVITLGPWSQVQADQVLVASAMSHLIGPTSSVISGLRRSLRTAAAQLRIEREERSQPTLGHDLSVTRVQSVGNRQRRLLIIRRGARSFQRTGAVIAALTPCGFEPICLEDLPFVDQVAMFASADAVIGVHGAGLANIVWCNAGAKLLECYPANYLNPCFRSLSAASGVEHSFIVSKVNSLGLVEADIRQLTMWAQSL